MAVNALQLSVGREHARAAVKAEVAVAGRTMVGLRGDLQAAHGTFLYVPATLQRVALRVTSFIGGSICNCAAIIILLLHSGSYL